MKQWVQYIILFLMCSGCSPPGVNQTQPVDQNAKFYSGFRILDIKAADNGGYNISYTFKNPTEKMVCFYIVGGDDIQRGVLVLLYHADGQRVYRTDQSEYFPYLFEESRFPRRRKVILEKNQKWNGTIYTNTDPQKYDAYTGEKLYFELLFAANGGGLAGRIPCNDDDDIFAPIPNNKPTRHGPITFPSKP